MISVETKDETRSNSIDGDVYLDSVEANKGKNERFLKDMDFLLRCIERMAGNSFRIKRWLSAALILFLGIVGREGVINEVTCGSIITIIVLLWVLDAYYMSLERIYRNRYRRVRSYGNDIAAYEDIIGNDLFELNPKNMNEDGTIGNGVSFRRYIEKYLLFSLFSITNVALYSSAISIIFVVTVNIMMPENLMHTILGSVVFVVVMLAVSIIFHRKRHDQRRQRRNEQDWT